MEPPKKKDAQKELDIALGELEDRVDRLRALYEQYFMGYEKLEPGVQRKDVERRFTVLRKTQIRNTAQRFRFNVVTQKYNTYVMYWTRICRQIEDGTYKRHVAKAARRFAPTETKRPVEESIDVDLGDFEELDEGELNAVLAEAAGTAPSPERHAPPTVAKPASSPIPVKRLTPGTPFSPRKPAESVPDSDEVLSPPPMDAGIDRRSLGAASPAQAGLPAGAKPRVLLRRRDNAPPEPTDKVPPAARPAAEPAPAPPPVRTPSAPDPNEVSNPAPAMRPPVRSSPDPSLPRPLIRPAVAAPAAIPQRAPSPGAPAASPGAAAIPQRAPSPGAPAASSGAAAVPQRAPSPGAPAASPGAAAVPQRAPTSPLGGGPTPPAIQRIPPRIMPVTPGARPPAPSAGTAVPLTTAQAAAHRAPAPSRRGLEPDVLPGSSNKADARRPPPPLPSQAKKDT